MFPFPPSRLPVLSLPLPLPLSLPLPLPLSLSLPLSLFLLLGCSDASATSSPIASARASNGPPQVELSTYCAQICKRTTACGVEALSKTVKGDPAEISVLARARDAAPATERSCSEGCAAGPSEPAADLARASYCLEQASCEALETCLANAAGESPVAGR